MELKTKEGWQKLLDEIDTLLFDCDGVLWSGLNSIIPGAQDVIKYLKSKGKKVYFVSNNGMKSQAEYLQKFKQLNFEVCQEEIFCMSYVTSYYMSHVLGFKGKVYLIGSDGFAKQLALEGIPSVGHGPDVVPENISDIVSMTLDPEIKAVLVTFDKHFSYPKLVKAASYAKKPDNLFLATNEDPNLPLESKEIVIPGTGCFVQCVKCAAGREPLYIGKPNPPMFEVIKKMTNLNPERTLMIGDRLRTDIKFGLRFGMKTLLVFTGATSREQLASETDKSMWPQYYTQSVAGFLTCL